MFYRLGIWLAAHARRVLVASVVVLIACGVLGVGAFSRLLSGGFDDPSSGSSQARTMLTEKFRGEPDFLFLVEARRGTVDSPAVVAAGTALAARVSQDPRLESVVSYWGTHAPALASRDHRYALILSTVSGDENQADKTAVHLLHDYKSLDNSAITVRLGGAYGTDIGGQVGKDIARAESIAVPLTIMLLIFAFGSLVSAMLPLSVGLLGIAGALAALSVLTHVTSVSVFAINLVTALGLGLGIDYALLMVSRFREELATGAEVVEAVARTTATAGRTIVFSAVTVMVALSAMLVFPVYFLKSFAYGGVGVTLCAALSALIVLPALLAVLGQKVNAGKVPGISATRGAEAPFWGRLATVVMRHPAMTALPAIAVLLLLASPFLSVSFGTPDQRVLPKSAPGHQVGDILQSSFATQPTPIDIVVEPAVSPAEISSYAHGLSALPGVQRVDSSAGSFSAGRTTAPDVVPSSLSASGSERITVSMGLIPSGHAAQHLVSTIRAIPPPPGAVVLVGGQTATLIDSKHAIGSRLLLAGLLIALSSFVVLFLFTGSVWQPLRALVSNALTMCATFGVMVWIFQEGHLQSLLGFTPAPTNTDMPVLLFCVAFGLSMDYEVFVMSRIKELHDQGATNTDAVVHGLARTGRIVSTAAVLLSVSFFAFATSRVSFIQLFGLGCGLAILIDATVVRGVLVPAFMRVVGEASWWAPAPLRRVHGRLGLDEPEAVLPQPA